MSRDEDTKPEEREIDVSHELEYDLSYVEQAIDEFLDTFSDSARNAMRVSLEHVDELCEASDIYQRRFSIPYPRPRSSVVGATSLNPIVEEVPGSIFEAQVDLVKAAKHVLAKTTAESLADLRSAVTTLKEMRGPSE
jgi:hypothetical protein